MKISQILHADWLTSAGSYFNITVLLEIATLFHFNFKRKESLYENFAQIYHPVPFAGLVF